MINRCNYEQITLTHNKQYTLKSEFYGDYGRKIGRLKEKNTAVERLNKHDGMKDELVVSVTVK